MSQDRDAEACSERTPLLSDSVVRDPSYSGSISQKDKGVDRAFSFDASTPSEEIPALETNCGCSHHPTDTINAQETSPSKPASGPSNAAPQRNCGWLSWFNSDFVALNLENSGSVARDHLASERTFLAYMRTSLAIASSGVALIQLFSIANRPPPQNVLQYGGNLGEYIRPLGGITILLGITVLFIGVARYFIVQDALTKGQFPAARLAVGYITLSLTALIALSFAVLLSGHLGPKVPGVP